ncbi:hypothetical protein SRHO_G00149240 [Serrasalmus rhombeus]
MAAPGFHVLSDCISCSSGCRCLAVPRRLSRSRSSSHSPAAFLPPTPKRITDTPSCPSGFFPFSLAGLREDAAGSDETGQEGIGDDSYHEMPGNSPQWQKMNNGQEI